LLVAEQAGAVVGWVRVRAAHDLERAARAVIEGLVVDAAARGQGAGAALLQRAEAWSAELGLAFVRLYSRIDRVAAHDFYDRRGYAVVATSHQLRKG
jgi:ribosomal protein S18 acetylase RimI-like enzyme